MGDSAAATVALTATKTARGENFPVGSWLLPRRVRPHVAAFYRFARTADDIADDPGLTARDKLARLSLLDRGLVEPGTGPAEAIRRSIGVTGTGMTDCRDLLVAFRRDAANLGCATWEDLVAYCRHSACPVGRYLLRLHGEDEATFASGDALCTALQINNHLQDCGDDWRKLARAYVPMDWIEAAGGPVQFFEPGNAAQRRPVLDRCLDEVDILLDRAAKLPEQLGSRRFAAEVQVMLWLARRLAARLRKDDPVIGRVALSRVDFARALTPALATVARGVRPVSDAVLVERSVVRAKTSFAAGMRILPAERRRGMYALYGYCRVVDDIADGAAPLAEKAASLDAWRLRLDRLYGGDAEDALGRELAWAIRRFALPRDELQRVLDGMMVDASPSVRLPDRVSLADYSRHVAGAVGILSVTIFGVPEASGFAVTLGETLQLTNILRDIDEDAAIARLYLPADWIAETGIDATGDIAGIVADPRFASVCERLAHETAARYAALPALLPNGTSNRMRSALIMQQCYQRIFDKLKRRGWTARGARPRLAASEKLLAIAAAYRA